MKNRAIVDEFRRNNPGLQDFAKSADATPVDRNVILMLDGNYRTVITSNGVPQTIETFGPSTKFGQLANTIVTAADPVNVSWLSIIWPTPSTPLLIVNFAVNPLSDRHRGI